MGTLHTTCKLCGRSFPTAISASLGRIVLQNVGQRCPHCKQVASYDTKDFRDKPSLITHPPLSEERLALLYRHSGDAIAIAADALRRDGKRLADCVIVVADLGHPSSLKLVQLISGPNDPIDASKDKGFVGVAKKALVSRSLRTCKIDACAVAIDTALGDGQIRVLVSAGGAVKLFDAKEPAPLPFAGSA